MPPPLLNHCFLQLCALTWQTRAAALLRIFMMFDDKQSCSLCRCLQVVMEWEHLQIGDNIVSVALFILNTPPRPTTTTTLSPLARMFLFILLSADGCLIVPCVSHTIALFSHSLPKVSVLADNRI